MDLVESFFKDRAENISFITLMEESSTKINEYKLDLEVPLPIITDSLVDEIQKGRLEEGLNIEKVIDGIIYTLGVDPNFEYLEDYIRILRSYNNQIEDYILYNGMKYLEEKNYEKAGIYFRAIKSLDSKHILGIFNLAMALEGIAKELLDTNDEEKGIKFLISSSNELETILDIDTKFPLSYYKLGYHYKYLGQFLKAKLIWSKYILLDKNEVRVQEIRDELATIEDDVQLESAITYLNHYEYPRALDILLKLESRFKDWWRIKYLMALSYKGMEEYEKAIGYFEIAMELNPEEADIYNELGICLFIIGNINGAIEIFNRGLEVIPNDYRLLFNIGLGYIQIEQFKEALEYIREAHKLNPNDPNIKAQLNELVEINEMSIDS